MASFIREIFLSTAGELLMSDLVGALKGGNGEMGRPWLEGDVTAEVDKEPQVEQKAGLLGKDPSDRADGDSWLP